MARVIGMDVHRDFAQVVTLEGERLRHWGRVQLDKDSLTSFAGRSRPMTRSCWKRQGTRSLSSGCCAPRYGASRSQTPCKFG